MKHYLLLFLLLIFTKNIAAGTDVEVGAYRGGKILTSFGPDSLYIEGEMLYFNCDTIFYRIMTEGYTPEVQNVNVHYFVDIVDHMPYEAQLKQVERFKEAGQKYNCKQIRNESDFIAIWYYPDSTQTLFEQQTQMMDKLIERMMKEKDVEFEVRCREFLANTHWHRGLYVRPFREFPIIDKLLDRITDVNKSGVNGASKKKFYYWFGQCYYLFRDFDKAVHYYKRATVQPNEYLYEPYHLYDETNLIARIALGRYYREIGDTETSDNYFRSMLASPDSLKRRDMFDAIAQCNLGENMQIRKEYTAAVQILECYLPIIGTHNRHSLFAEMAVSLGECYLALNRLENARTMLDSASHHLSLAGGGNHISLSYAFAGNTDHIPALHRLRAKYYAQKGNIAMASASIDSSAYYLKYIDERYNSLVILRAEQQLFEAEKDELQQESILYQTRMIYALAIAGLVLLLLVVYIYLYRQKRRAYHILVERSEKWASEENVLDKDSVDSCDKIISTDSKDSPLNENLSLIIQQFRQLVLGNKLYKTSDVTLDSVAEKLNINRVYLSQAINQITGNNFTFFINENRIKEAIRIMSDKQSNNYSLDEIAFEVGFNDRTSFYRAFKKMTGISPSEFRKNQSI